MFITAGINLSLCLQQTVESTTAASIEETSSM